MRHLSISTRLMLTSEMGISLAVPGKTTQSRYEIKAYFLHGHHVNAKVSQVLR